MLDSAVMVAWRRKVDEFAVVSLVFLVITAVVSLVGAHTARALLIKDSGVTGLFGLLCLATLLAPRPLMFYFGRKFATDGTPESAAWWNGLWQFDGFRSTMRTITLVWGVGYLVEALVRIVLAYALSTSAMVVLSPVLIYATLGALALWTAWFSRRRAAEGPGGRPRPRRRQRRPEGPYDSVGLRTTPHTGKPPVPSFRNRGLRHTEVSRLSSRGGGCPGNPGSGRGRRAPASWCRARARSPRCPRGCRSRR